MKKPRVLFVCTYQGARSKIAEIFARELDSDQIDAFSSCFENDRIGRLPIEVMEEVGLTLSEQPPKSVFARFADKETFDYVVTLCHEATSEECPVFVDSVDALYATESKRIAWSVPSFVSIEGSETEKLEQARNIRDQIKQEVANFLETISGQEQP